MKFSGSIHPLNLTTKVETSNDIHLQKLRRAPKNLDEFEVFFLIESKPIAILLTEIRFNENTPFELFQVQKYQKLEVVLRLQCKPIFFENTL